MRALNILLGSLLWIVAGLVLLLGAVLSITIVLLPVGIPLFLLGQWLMRMAMALLVPRAVRHPLEAGRKKGSKTATKVRKRTKGSWKKVRKALS
ncbi:MAG: hypothetical protein J7518_04730 [Nocardioidaceae bacterium]|nr:hypothetical protein [Nocardioidaceae bacterium]